MSNITLSFIIPVYNVENYVAQCLESVLTQIDVFPGSEIIVVNDGSKDRSMDIVRKYATSNPCIRILDQENQGLSMARNHGMSIAHGDYIWLIDSDDWLEEGALSLLKETMAQHPNMDLYATGMRWTYPDGTITLDIKPGDYSVMDSRYLQERLPIGASQRYIQKRSFVEANHLHFFPGILHEDGPYGRILIHCAESIKVLPRPVYGYRQREGSIMNSLSIRSAYDCVKGHRYLMEYSDTIEPEEKRRAFKAGCLSLLIASISFTHHLIGTEDFGKFLQDEKGYIDAQLRLAAPHANPRTAVRLFLALHCPALYFKGWVRLKKFIKRCIGR